MKVPVLALLCSDSTSGFFMTINEAISIYFTPGDDGASMKLTTAEILKMLSEHIEVFPEQINDVNDALISLNFQTIVENNRIVWLLESK